MQNVTVFGNLNHYFYRHVCPSFRLFVHSSVSHKNFFSLKSPWNHPLNLQQNRRQLLLRQCSGVRNQCFTKMDAKGKKSGLRYHIKLLWTYHNLFLIKHTLVSRATLQLLSRNLVKVIFLSFAKNAVFRTMDFSIQNVLVWFFKYIWNVFSKHLKPDMIASVYHVTMPNCTE